jgi:uncharacterized protein
MLKIDIGSIPDGSSELDVSADASELDVSLEGARLTGPVELRLSVTRNGDDILLRGTARVQAIFECARCLEEYRLVLEAPIELWCIAGAGSQASDGERDNVLELPAGARQADLTDYIRSELVVLLPLKPLCSDTCRGLCPVCGVNLNFHECSCRRESGDGRWDALKKIK